MECILTGPKQDPHVFVTLGNVQGPARLPRKTASELQKLVGDHKFLTLLTSKCALRCSRVHFLNRSTSKSAPGLRPFFVCFTPQPRALFEHFIFQKRSDTAVFFNFDLEMGFAPHWRALATSQLPKVIRTEVLCTF